MQKIEAIVRPEKFGIVGDALTWVGISGHDRHGSKRSGAARRVSVRYGAEEGTVLTCYRRSRWKSLLKTRTWKKLSIQSSMNPKRGGIGDGKIFIFNVENVSYIRTKGGLKRCGCLG